MTALSRIAPAFTFGSWRARFLIERNVYVYRRTYMTLLSGFFEPLFYLLAMGFGLGALIGQVPGPDGHPISYTAFIAPALLAASAMNGAVYDSTFNVFFRLNYEKVYNAVLATPLGVGDVALGEISGKYGQVGHKAGVARYSRSRGVAGRGALPLSDAMTTFVQSGRSVRRYLTDRLDLLQQTIEHLGARLREGDLDGVLRMGQSGPRNRAETNWWPMLLAFLLKHPQTEIAQEAIRTRQRRERGTYFTAGVIEPVPIK